MKYKYIIWDWNGTLFDDVSICIDAMNEVLKKTGGQNVLTYDYYRERFCFPVRDYYEKIGLDFNSYSFDFLANLYMDIYTGRQFEAGLNPQARDVLERLKDAGAEQIILSASETGRLKTQIDNFNIADFFSHILGTDNIYAHSKVDVAKRFIENNDIDRESIAFVGDTAHDLETAQSIGCRALLVSCGHQNREILENAGADVFDSLESVCDYILG